MSRRRRQRGFLQFGTSKVNDSDSLSGDFYKVTTLNFVLFFLIISPIISAIEAYLHRNDSDLTFYNNNLTTLILTSIFVVVLIGTMRIKLVTPDYYATGLFKKIRGVEVVLIQSIIGITSILAVWFVTWLAEVFRLEVLPFEIVIFYVNAAIAEEIWFRMFGITIVKIMVFIVFKVTGLLGGEKNKRIRFSITNVVAVALTSIIFMVAHLDVYGDQTVVLLSTLFAGVAFGTLYVVFKNNPFPGLIGHVFNNMIAAFIIISGG